MESSVRFTTWLTALRRAACRLLPVCAAFGWLLAAEPVRAERKEPLPKGLEGVGVTPHFNAVIPRELPFIDSSGKETTIGQMFDRSRPVLLTMNYSNCPMLCSLQLNGLFQGLQGMPWDIGDKFQVVTVSIDPAETTERAAETKQKYLRMYGRPGGQQGWHVLTGREENIKKLADVVGFGYRWDPKQEQFAHEAVTMVCTPDGRVARYLRGIDYPPQTLKLALVEAADGKIGTTLDQVILYCFHYDPDAGRYNLAAVSLMRIGGLATLVALAIGLALFWRRDLRRGRSLPPQANP